MGWDIEQVFHRLLRIEAFRVDRKVK